MNDMLTNIGGGADARAGKRLADRETPLILNCWYVAALSDEVGRKPMDRWLLNRPVVLYRTTDRRVVALHNRCAHRSMPLSKGYLEGDLLVCGYHGMAYNAGGTCVRVPSEPKTPANVCVKSYPIVERMPFVWIWMGDPELADPAQIPETPWFEDPTWTFVHGAMPVRANYVRLHENLLDLTHFTYLHPNNVGTPEYASAPFSTETHGDRVRIFRELKNSTIAPLYGWPMGIEGKKVDRSSDSWFLSPAFHVAHAKIVDNDPEPGRPGTYKVEVIHAITPENATSTHYFWAQARDFALHDLRLTKFTKDALLQAFQEDKDALQWIEEIYDRDETEGFFEMSVAGDKPGLQMRRIIQRLAMNEMRAKEEKRS